MIIFCQAGRDFDQQLAQLGGNRLLPLIEADVNYKSEAENWSQQVVTQSRWTFIPMTSVLSPSLSKPG